MMHLNRLLELVRVWSDAGTKRRRQRVRKSQVANRFRYGHRQALFQALESRAMLAFVPAPGSPVAITSDPSFLTSGDFNRDGNIDLVTSNGTAGTLTVLLGSGTGGFGTPSNVTVSTGASLRSVKAADLNSDGLLDLVVADSSMSSVWQLEGNGDGTFRAPIANFGLGDNRSVDNVIADFTGDGLLDVATITELSSGVLVNRNTGAGNFQFFSGAQFSSVPTSITAGDINGDGRIDLAIASSAGNHVAILLANSDRTFPFSPTFTIDVGGLQPSSVALADVTGDGKLDLVTANAGDASVSILSGAGDGTFSQLPGFPRLIGQLPSSVKVADLNGDGRLDIVTANRNSNDLGILLGNGGSGFAPTSSVSVGDAPSDVIIADFNGDGRLDLAAANESDLSVSIMLNNSAPNSRGRFAHPLASPIAVGGGPKSIALGDPDENGRFEIFVAEFGSNRINILDNTGSGFAHGFLILDAAPQAVATADIDRDGHLDFVTAIANGTVQVFFGNGAGFFTIAAPLTIGSDPRMVVTADFNGDGELDLATANYGSDNVSILLNDGNRGFTPVAGSPIAVGDRPFGMAASDINGDGRVDLGVTNYGSNTASILLGNGTGAFSVSSVTVGDGPCGVVLADVDGDGKPDLVTANYRGNNVSVLMNLGGAQFSGGATVGGGVKPIAIAAGDFDGDGDVDLAVAEAGSDSVSILRNLGTGDFPSDPVPLNVGSRPYSIQVGDLDGDGQLDLVTANRDSDNLTLLLGNGAGRFSEAKGASEVTVTGTPAAVAAGDLDGDGDLDLVTGNYNSEEVAVLLGSGYGSFLPGPTLNIGNSPFSIKLADLDGDGDLDAVTGSYVDSTITILLGNGDGGFSQAPGSPIVGAGALFGLAVGDIDGDGIPDLVAANYLGSADVSLLLGNGDGTFESPVSVPIGGTGPLDVALADLDADGDLDLIVALGAAGKLSVLSNLGSGLFGFPLLLNVGTTPRSIAAGDVDGDGDLDLVAANNGSDDVSILLGNGDGQFATATSVTVGDQPISIAISDLNGDGRLDLAVANSADDTVDVLFGNGAGGFASAVGSTLTVGDVPFAVVAADLNGDGLPDLVTANTTGSTVSIRLGQHNSATHFQLTAPATVLENVVFDILIAAQTAENLRDSLYNGSIQLTLNGFALNLSAFPSSFGNALVFKVGMDGQTGISIGLTAGTFTFRVSDTLRPDVFGELTVVVNAAPTFTGSLTLNAFEDQPLNALIATADAEGNARTITAITLPSWLSVTDNGNGTASLTGTPRTSHIGAATATLQVVDSVGNIREQSFTITVANTNDAPSGANKTITKNEDTTHTFTAADFGFTDPNDSTANALASVRMTTLPSKGSLELNGVAVTAGQNISVANINSGLLKFTPALHGKGNLYTLFSFRVQDNGGTANGGVNLDPTPNLITFNITSVNDAPSGISKTITKNEDTTHTFTVADFKLADANDVPSNALAAVTISTLPVRGSLKLGGVAVTAGQSISVASINSGLLKFTPALHGKGTTYTLFTFRVQDNGGTANGGVNLDPTPNLITFNITSVNDAPSGISKTITKNEDATHVFTVADFKLVDASDLPANALAAVTISTLPAKGSLKLNGVAVTAGQSISVVSINAGLFSFTPALNGHGAAYTSFTFRVQDNGGTANGGVNLDPTPNSMTFNITSVNDAPSGANKSITKNEGVAHTFTAADFGFSDASDSPANAFLYVRITTLQVKGFLKLDNVIVTAGQNILVADINAGLLKFTPVPNGNGFPFTSFTFQVQDNGGAANGGVNLDPTPNTITFNMNSVNDAPSGTDKTIFQNEDSLHTFTVADFGLSDESDFPENEFAFVKVTTLPAQGVLKLNNVAVTAGQNISRANLHAGLLEFTPALNGTGKPFTSFTFQVQDNGGTADGGVNLDPTPNTITFNVRPVNDSPEVDLGGSLNYERDAAAILLAPGATANDVDNANLDLGRLRVRITTGSSSTNQLGIGACFSVDANDMVSFGQIVIGKRLSNGVGTNELQILFNANATLFRVQKLVQAINFKTSGGAVGKRVVLFTLSDGIGGISDNATKTVEVL